ncbi:phenylalanyl-tRNA synthetase alpha subunit, mitochondrial [Rhizina undulata]
MPLCPATTLHSASRAVKSGEVFLRIRRICAPAQLFNKWRPYSTNAAETIEVGGRTFPKDEWTNTPPHIAAALPRKLHLQPSHPLAITRTLIESRFPKPTYKTYNELSPIVSVHQNFDSLGFPADHPGRSRTDTYYINAETVLRTHTSAHQADTFRAAESEGFLISADVYRRDAIDRSHYPVFHQMEGARMWSRSEVPGGDVAKAVWEDIERMPKHNLKVEDPNPTIHAERNPLQPEHSAEECEAIAAHLKRSLENVVVEVFGQAKKAAVAAGEATEDDEPLRVRWIEAYFPFTSPSWELEVFWQGDWLELLGCGVVRQHLPANAGVPDKIGWAFGVGLERVAMLLFGIPDIRLFWSKDSRLLSQFSEGNIARYIPFSKHPPCYKDVAFWLKSTSNSGGDQPQFHENDMMEIVRDIGGDLVEDVRLVDEFTHPKTGRKSLCWRINYRSLERTLTNEEVNALQERVRQALVDSFGVELR